MTDSVIGLRNNKEEGNRVLFLGAHTLFGEIHTKSVIGTVIAIYTKIYGNKKERRIKTG